MLSEKEIDKMASLARINLGDREKEKFRRELSVILDYINKLNNVNTDNSEPLYQATGLSNSVRRDEPRNSFILNEDLEKKLIGQAPSKEGRFIKVKSVLNKR